METESPQPLLEIRSVGKNYSRTRVLDDASLSIPRLSTMALVGASGAGKSTLARCIVGLERPDTGQILFQGCDVVALSRIGWRTLRGRIQLVFQDSATSLNPRFTAAQVIEEPLRIQSRTSSKERRRLVLEMLVKVGLAPDSAERSPLELSGGQRQRLAIARALIQKPELLILDEVLTGLDLSIQAQIINLLLDLQSAHSLTYLVITHNVRVASYLADNVAVMWRGQIVESGNTAEVFSSPQADHTRQLLASMPGLLAKAQQEGARCPI